MTNGEPDDGGLDELVEFIPSRRFNSAFSASSTSSRAPRVATNAALGLTLQAAGMGWLALSATPSLPYWDMISPTLITGPA